MQLSDYTTLQDRQLATSGQLILKIYICEIITFFMYLFDKFKFRWKCFFFFDKNVCITYHKFWTNKHVFFIIVKHLKQLMGYWMIAAASFNTFNTCWDSNPQKEHGTIEN